MDGLEFGNDIHLAGSNVTNNELNKVTKRTNIQFPKGTRGLGYFFLGSGIDDSLALKVGLCEELKAAFMENDIFKTDDNAKPSIQTVRGKPWWKLAKLKESVDRQKQLTQGRYMACTLGREDGQWGAYISWMST
ncbi:MAG: hypothetical protein VYE44_03565 [Verrucomicrobiota bacterium]|nr:hypothetical protein [Verrucomicrobiota bacterium]